MSASAKHNASKLILYGWVIYLVSFPFYVFESGMPQPADLFLALFIIIAFLNGYNFFNVKYLPAVALRYFVLYVFIVNTTWAFFIDQSMEKRFPSYFHTLFYIFNYLVFIYCIYIYQRFGRLFLLYTAYGVGISMIVQTILAFFLGNFSGRESLFFNNPNQLGYYALLAGSIFVYLARTINMPVIFQIPSYLSFFYLCLLSSSKAAMAGASVLVLLPAINKGLLSFKQVLVLLSLVLIGNYFINETEVGNRLFSYAFNRFHTIGESKDDSVEGRGYDRMLNDPEYMILGAGEGGYYRFDTLLDTGEIHSSLGTILFCYGIIGFTYFTIFIVRIFNKLTFIDFIFFLPVLIYSVTHQGLRSTLFWVFLSVFYISGLYIKSRKDRIFKYNGNNFRKKLSKEVT
jgi:hypothetical protein